MSLKNIARRIGWTLRKPEYLFSPTRIFNVFLNGGTGSGEIRNVRLPWGTNIEIRPKEDIGSSIARLGVYEIAISEVLWRLLDRGETFVDAGANIGYMTTVMAARVGATGRGLSFEPHPVVFERLSKNLSQDNSEHTLPALELYQLALGEARGELELVEPDAFGNNEGTARLETVDDSQQSTGKRFKVEVRPLDSFVGADQRIGVMKIDVEGAELSVMKGAAELIRSKRIRDIVFEDFEPYPSRTVKCMTDAGYAVRRISKGLFGPILWAPSVEDDDLGLPWEPVNYVATSDPARLERLTAPRGWFVLKGDPST